MRLDQAGRGIEITDVIDGGGHDVRLAFHLGPDVTAELAAGAGGAELGRADSPGTARLELPREFKWSRTGARPIRSSAGTRPGWASVCPP